jgi:hypothetical protein
MREARGGMREGRGIPLHDGGKVIVQNDDVGGVLGDFSAGHSHGETYGGCREGRGIVGTVTGY